jgi:hypothetical protein
MNEVPGHGGEDWEASFLESGVWAPVKAVIQWLVILGIALVIGVGSALWLIHHPPVSRGIRNGPWMTNALIGSRQANMYLRAWVARLGLFALNRTETIYFTAFTDESGEPLRAQCDYVVTGGALDTRWWSITVYGRDHFLIPNNRNRYSYHMRNVQRDSEGRYRIHLSNRPRTGDWLPTGGQGTLSLTLRLYNPSPTIYNNLETVNLPRIVKEGCP